MNVAPVDRLGAWLPSGSDPRTAAATRVQTVAAEATSAAGNLPLASATELPVLAVKAGNAVQGQAVPPSGAELAGSNGVGSAGSVANASSGGAGKAASSVNGAAATPEPTLTVNAFPSANAQNGVQGGPDTHRATAAGAAGAPPNVAQSAAHQATEAALKPLNQPPTASEKARAAAKEAVNESVKQPAPAAAATELISVMHSVWAASSHAVISNAAKLSASHQAGASGTSNSPTPATTQAALSAYGAVQDNTPQSSSS